MKQCEYEDSTNCIWNAQEQGNGVGESFIDINGSAYYLSHVGVGLEVLVIGVVVLALVAWIIIKGRK